MRQIIVIALGVLFASSAFAEQAKFTGQDYSGVYDCTGDDAHEGKYTGKVTLAIKPEHSRKKYASYDFN